LQGLNKKHPVIDLTVAARVAMRAFALKKKLLFHGGQPFPRAAPREL